MSNKNQTVTVEGARKGLGWLPDKPDHRDLYLIPNRSTPPEPSLVNLRDKCPPVYDQGELGSCTANAIGAAVQFDMFPDTWWPPSRLFIYYNERDIEGTVDSDSGAEIRDGIKAIAALGVCTEDDWPYDVSKFTDKPSQKAYSDAAQDLVRSYARIEQTLTSMESCLAAGRPFVAGITCYPELQDPAVAQSGDLPLPTTNDAPIGGHAILIVGYDRSRGVFFWRNSWGEGWGDKGYGTLPYQYLTNPDLSSDFWVVNAL